MVDSLQPLDAVPFPEGSRPKLLDRCGRQYACGITAGGPKPPTSTDPAIHRLSPQETSVDDGSPRDHGVPVVAGDRPTCQLIDPESGAERCVVSLSSPASHPGWRHRTGTGPSCRIASQSYSAERKSARSSRTSAGRCGWSWPFSKGPDCGCRSVWNFESRTSTSTGMKLSFDG